MAKKEKAPKEPKQRKAKKIKEPQYYSSATNMRTLNYKVYYMSGAEKILYFLIGFIVGAAVGEGMEKIKLPAEVQLIPTTEPVKYEGRTNWFDKFCDFLSKIIGG